MTRLEASGGLPQPLKLSLRDMGMGHAWGRGMMTGGGKRITPSL